MTSISQVLLLRNSKASHELGQVLWAALVEIETFYNFDQHRANFNRTYLSDTAPQALLAEIPSFWIDQIHKPESGDAFIWKQAQGLFTRTYDYRKIVYGVSQLLEPHGHSAPYVIVTDQELTPPPDWRYIPFNGDERGVVVSTAPADPNYWRDRHPHRLSVIKHRVRTAGLNAVGTYLGLKRCDNPECFLYSEINSVSNLDAMVKLGPEHELPNLVGRGFGVIVSEPDVPQPVVLNAIPPEMR